MHMIQCSVWITESCYGLKFPSGLTNLWNICFANATLQAILHIPLQQEYINKHEECCKNCYCQHYNDINVLLATLCCLKQNHKLS